MFANCSVYVKNINKYFFVNDYKVNEMIMVFNLKFFYAILNYLHSVLDLVEKMTTFLDH